MSSVGRKGEGMKEKWDAKRIERAVLADRERPCLYHMAGPCFHPNCLESHFHNVAEWLTAQSNFSPALDK
jgi:hypothetical protein